jgi:hypothetical protein
MITDIEPKATKTKTGGKAQTADRPCSHVAFSGVPKCCESPRWSAAPCRRQILSVAADTKLGLDMKCCAGLTEGALRSAPQRAKGM